MPFGGARETYFGRRDRGLDGGKKGYWDEPSASSWDQNRQRELRNGSVPETLARFPILILPVELSLTNPGVPERWCFPLPVDDDMSY